MLPTEEPVWLAIFSALELLDLGVPQILAHHHARGLADMLDLRDGDQAALVVPEDQRRPSVSAEIYLPRHHLLHGEVAGRHAELLELETAFLQQAGAQQVIGRHAPEIGLVALADRGLREGWARREAGGEQRTGGGESVAAGHLRHGVPPLPPAFAALLR